MTRFLNAAAPDAPKNDNVNRDLLGYSYTGKGPYFNWLPNLLVNYPIPATDVGRYYGNKPAGCSNPMPVNKNGNPTFSSGQQRPIAIVANNRIRLEPLSDNNAIVTFGLYDISGRIIQSGQVSNAQPVIYEKQYGAPVNMHILKMSNADGSFIQKMLF